MLQKFVTFALLISLESTFGEGLFLGIAVINVDNLILSVVFLITLYVLFRQNIILSSGDNSMKDWKALILKITLLVLVGIVMLTG